MQDMVMVIFSDSTMLTAENLKRIKDIDRDISKVTGVTKPDITIYCKDH